VVKLAENAQRQIDPAAWSPSRGGGEDRGEEEKEPLLTVRTTSPPPPSSGATANVDGNGGRGNDNQLQRRTSLEIPGAGFVLDEASATYNVRPTCYPMLPRLILTRRLHVFAALSRASLPKTAGPKLNDDGKGQTPHQEHLDAEGLKVGAFA